MDFDTSVIGQTLESVPLGKIVENLGVAIATAQERLDNVAIETALRLANTTVTLYDGDGNEVVRSLLELGFSPTFYQFTEATIEVSFVATMQVAEITSVGFGLRLGGSIASADQAEERLTELGKQEKGLDADMAKKKEQIEKDREATLEQAKKQKEKFEELLKKNQKDGKDGG